MRELNWKPGQSAELSILGDGDLAGPAAQAARIIEFSGKRMRVASAVEVKTAPPCAWNGMVNYYWAKC
jgi:hypothetical protein